MERCPLCEFRFVEESTTGQDVTPYARAYAAGAPGWLSMCEWTWLAGSARLKHLALMRASAASRRFARINGALLLLGLAGWQGARSGWRWVTGLAAIEPGGSLTPRGQGWLHAAAMPRPLPPALSQEQPVDLWWNATQSALGVCIGVVAACLGLWLSFALLRFGVVRIYAAKLRLERRMTAALHYSTAWFPFITAGLLVLALLPWAYAGSMARWNIYPPELGLTWAGSVITAGGVGLWWFWLVRLGATETPRLRARAVAFYLLGVPLIVGGLAAGWYFGLNALLPQLHRAMALEF